MDDVIVRMDFLIDPGVKAPTPGFVVLWKNGDGDGDPGSRVTGLPRGRRSVLGGRPASGESKPICPGWRPTAPESIIPHFQQVRMMIAIRKAPIQPTVWSGLVIETDRQTKKNVFDVVLTIF